jgi:hypothetical protein
MDLRCCYHPDRGAVGECCYCERPLCEECISTNRKGQSYCRQEDNCLAYQEGQSSDREPISPLVAYLLDERSLDAQVERVSEILGELGELESLFAEDDRRIPGFCACRLAEEADALVKLISLRVEFIRREREPSGEFLAEDKARNVKVFIETEAEPKIREALNLARPYDTLDGFELLALVAGRTKQEGE